ncbi:MAG: AAA family ATPase [Thermodesulfobacteriota bacterium]|nr:AAA family ATPase [Thermodesulfobacteriota bacterium]
MKLSLDLSQQQAVESILNIPGLSVLTGGPGYGKTHSIFYLLEQEWGGKFNCLTTYLATPTGKAAKVLDEALSKDENFYLSTINKPMTIHRMLGCQGKHWIHNSGNRLNCDLLILDESSMIDSALLARVITSVNKECKIVLVGDSDQLAPVGPGCPFRDIVASGRNVSRLAINHRQEQGSRIAGACEAIKVGKWPVSISGSDGNDGDLFFHELEDKEDIPAQTVEICREWQENNEDYVVLSPQRSGVCGVESINLILQQKLNPARQGKKELEVAPWLTFREGDKVLVTKNNYKLNVFNGFMGVILEIDILQNIVIDFDGEIVVFQERKDIKNLALGYCLTYHKSQGSEYRKGIIICHSTHYFMLSRSLLYVGVSRFQDELHIIGDKKGLRRAIKNNTTSNRQTYLSQAMETFK